MVDFILLQNVLVAIALGALIGLEREYARFRKRGHDFAGIRTFPLITLFGALAAYFGEKISPWILVAAVLIMGVLIILAYLRITSEYRKDMGTTSEVAGLLAFFIGVLCFYGEIVFALVLAIIITIILYARSTLHGFAEKISPEEMAKTLTFAVIAFIILPLLPNKAYGPLGIFNPYLVWLMVVFISGISLIGYILIKWLGERGVVLSGILGGIAGSTATTMSFADRSMKERKLYRALVLGVVLANGIMFARILIEVLVLNRELFVALLLPMIILTVIGIIFAYFLWTKTENTHGGVHLHSPFTLGPALKFAVFFAIILALIKIASTYFSTQGIYAVSFLSGFVDVDAAVLSLAQLGETVNIEIARNGIILAAIVNTAVKGGIAYWFGSREFGRTFLIFCAVLIAVGIGLMWLL